MKINEIINTGSPNQFVIGHFLSTSKSELLEHVVSVPRETEIATVIKHFVSRNATV